MPVRNRILSSLAAVSLILAAGCSDSNNSPDPVVGPVAEPFQELIDQGVTRYLGVYSPMVTETEGDIVNYTFGAGDGPLCLDGSEYTMATRDKGSDELVIFLQGGGACWSQLCLATESADKGIPKAGILDPDLAGNPVAEWNTVYLPYCDGGLHASDADSDTDGDGQNDRFQRGLHNLSAALDVAVTTFPSPKRILLTGISAGGFGTTYALPLVRSLYPGIPIEVINDSGLGLARPGEPEFVELLMNDWNMAAFIPASCDNCIGADGHTTDYHKWELAQDDNIRLSMMSYKRDSTIALTFVQVAGEEFEKTLLEETADLEAAFPERMHSFIANGNSHTFLLYDTSITAGGVTVLDWVSAMLDGSPDWVSTSD
ncbi:MAG: vtpJ-therm [Pseudomonadales bacterium]|nr:vtpJ-therm [Pseudomonadales bacterium]